MNTYLRLRDYLAASETAASYVIEKRPDADVLDRSLGRVAGGDELVLLDAAHPQELTWSTRYPSPRGDPTLISEYLRYFRDCTSITEPDDGLRAGNVIASSGAMYVWLSPRDHLTGDVVTTPRCQLRGVPGSLFGAPGFLKLCATSVRTASLKNALGEAA